MVRHSDEKKEKVRKLLRKGGMRHKDIAEQAGVPRSIVSRIACESGFAKTQGGKGKIEKQEIPEKEEPQPKGTRFTVNRSGLFFENELQDRKCKFPVQIDGDRHRWCNAPSYGLTYCPDHALLSRAGLSDARKKEILSRMKHDRHG